MKAISAAIMIVLGLGCGPRTREGIAERSVVLARLQGSGYVAEVRKYSPDATTGFRYPVVVLSGPNVKRMQTVAILYKGKVPTLRLRGSDLVIRTHGGFVQDFTNRIDLWNENDVWVGTSRVILEDPDTE